MIEQDAFDHMLDELEQAVWDRADPCNSSYFTEPALDEAKKLVRSAYALLLEEYKELRFRMDGLEK